jgi:SWI/SNF-related matrix-associated actin-dependent regulator of chromatin subfamily A3
MSTRDLEQFDVVITTYQTITGQHTDVAAEGALKKKKKVERSLFEVNWKVSDKQAIPSPT